MKKKSFFNGTNARMALVVLALSGALFTGCYKDDGLDANGPTGEVVLPAAKYTVSGTVIDAETLQPIANASVNATATVNGGFSFAVTDVPAEGKDVTLTAEATGYAPTTTSVKVLQVSSGQSAVYTTVIALSKTVEVPVYYNLTVNAVDENMAAVATAKHELHKAKDLSAIDVSAWGELTSGSYVIKTSDAAYVTMITNLELPAVTRKVAYGSDAANAGKIIEDKDIVVILTEAPASLIKVGGDLKIGGEWLVAKVVRMYNKTTGTQYFGKDNANAYTYSFDVPVTEFATITRADGERSIQAEFVIIDQNDVIVTFTQKIVAPATAVGEDGAMHVSMEFEFELANSSDTKSVKRAPWTANLANTSDTDVVTGEFNVHGVKVGNEWGEDYAASAKEVLQPGSPMYNALIGAYEAIGLVGVTETEVKVPYEIQPMSILTKAVFVETYAIDIYKVGKLMVATTIDNVTSSQETDIRGLNTVRGVLNNYQPMTVTGEYSYKGIDHAHGHGGNYNAGGGIIEVE